MTGTGAGPGPGLVDKPERPRPVRRRSCTETHACSFGTPVLSKPVLKDPSIAVVSGPSGPVGVFKGIFTEVRLSQDIPYYFRTTASSETPAEEFFPKFSRFFGLGSDDRMVIDTREDAKPGFGSVPSQSGALRPPCYRCEFQPIYIKR